MKLEDYFLQRKDAVESFLKELPAPSGKSKKLWEAMRYSLLAGGKRLRPILAMASYEACSQDDHPGEEILPFAAALEMIHTYSLIHDDLPAMDNDDWRRGRPTAHKAFGEAVAILAGDALLTEAFGLMARHGPNHPCALEVIADIAEASGVSGMAGGQLIDLDSQDKEISFLELQELHAYKTGRLIQVCVTTGAKLAGADTRILDSMRDYGAAIGLAFQITDDILDVVAGSESLGKTTGKDDLQKKSTYPRLLGLESARHKAAAWVDRATDSLKALGVRGETLREIACYVVSRGH